MAFQLASILLNHDRPILQDKPALERRLTLPNLPQNMPPSTTDIHNRHPVVARQTAELFRERVQTMHNKRRVLRHHGVVEPAQPLGELGDVIEHGLAGAVVHERVGVVGQRHGVLPVVLG